MREDTVALAEIAHVGAAVADHQPVQWRCAWTVIKRWGDDLTVDPYEVIEGSGNLLMYGGASCLWEALIGNGTASAGQNLTYFSSSQAALGVGDSNASEAAGQNDLQASSNKLRVAATASHTDGIISGSASITFTSTFSTAQANWVWSEWGVFNSSTAATGRMLNRKVAALGTKTSAASWSLQISLSIS